MAYSLIPQGIRALITALGPAGAAQVASEQIKENPELANSIDQAFRRVLMGPSEELISKFQETPSGIVFGPDVQAQEEAREVQKKFLQPAKPGGIDMKELLMPGDQQATPNPLEDPLVSKPIPTEPVIETFPTSDGKEPLILKSELKDNNKDKVQKFFDKQETLFDDDYEKGVKSYSEDYPLTDQAVIGMEDVVQTRPNQFVPVHRYWEDMWAGGVGDVGERLAGEVMRSGGMLETSEGIKAPSYYEEYKGKLQDLAVKELGKDFVGYRLMSRAEMEDMLKGGKSIGDVKSYSLDKDKALAFKNFANEAFTDRETGKPRTDLVLAEAPLNYEGLVMRGKADEKEVVYDNQFTSMNEINFYDLDGKLIKAAEKGMLLQKEKPEELNQIKTWEVGPFKNIEEAKQAAKDNKITFEDLQRAGIRKQITFKKSKDILGYDVYFDKKLIGQIEDMTEELRANNPDVLTNKKAYQLSTIDAYGNVGIDPYDTVDGLADAKWVISNDIAKSFIDNKDEDWSLSKIFPKIKYDKKGLPIKKD